ncbi:MAG: sensor histidine kinase [Dermatophilaceae bacterium]|nr:sensor histidine kinase [Intrasporangiaceae bacterium]
MTRARWATDVVLAVLVATLGMTEVWLPMESVMGDGSPVVSTIGVLAFSALLTQRRARPWLALAALLVWPLLGIAQGGRMQVLFFGQLVPMLVLVYSGARHGSSRSRWATAVGGVLFVAAADLFIPILREPSELVFHWGLVILAYLLGHALRVAEDRATAEAVRAHLAEAAAREESLAAVAEERARIARELHDIVAHSVGLIVVQAGAAEQVVEEDPDFARRALGTIRTTGSSALGEMRRLVSVLRDADSGADFAPQPGLSTLPELVASTREAGLDVDLTVIGDRRELPKGVDLAVYRIVQEALTNVRRHSAAVRAQVRLDVGPDSVRIEVADAGPARAGRPTPGHGLVGMRERVALYGGQLDAMREEDGFTVRARLPLETT